MSGWILESGDPPLVIRLARESVKSIGRAPEADFIVDAPLISRVHCRLEANRSGQLVVEDLSSTNGTLVNGARVERAVLKDGDVLTVGRVSLTCRTA